MKKTVISLFALTVLLSLTLAIRAQDDDAGWIFLGSAHVDGQHDHDKIEVGEHAGRYRFLQIRVVKAPIEFDHVLVHFEHGEDQTLDVRDVIRAGERSRAIPLDGDRVVKSLELWYSKAHPHSRGPQVNLWGQR